MPMMEHHFFRQDTAATCATQAVVDAEALALAASKIPPESTTSMTEASSKVVFKWNLNIDNNNNDNDYHNNNDDRNTWFWWDNNASLKCTSSSLPLSKNWQASETCCDSYYGKALKWAHRIVLYIAQSYSRQFIVLFVGPLLLGVLIGYLIWGNNNNKNYSQNHRSNDNAGVESERRDGKLQQSNVVSKVIDFDESKPSTYLYKLSLILFSNLLRIKRLVFGRTFTSLEKMATLFVLDQEERAYSNKSYNTNNNNNISFSTSERDVLSDNTKLHDVDETTYSANVDICFEESPAERDERTRKDLLREEQLLQKQAKLANTTTTAGNDFTPAASVTTSGLSSHEIPRHIAIIMDGNRRYGREQHNNTRNDMNSNSSNDKSKQKQNNNFGNFSFRENPTAMGHWYGSRKVLQVCTWCLAENKSSIDDSKNHNSVAPSKVLETETDSNGIRYLTLYCFSTENWQRSAQEIQALLSIIVQYCDELLPEALERNIRVRVWSTDPQPLPQHVRDKLQMLQDATQHCTGNGSLCLNLCLSYGSRNEIIQATKSIAQACQNGRMSIDDIDADVISQHLLSADIPPPDILIRTSGEMRLSNFLLWQLAYTELFFVQQHWPALTQRDFVQILQQYAQKRQRRYGK